MSATSPRPDGRPRCGWATTAPEFIPYHDGEWGFPVADDIRLFEKLSLEGFQAGLSWLTILRKREAFRRAFAGFDFERVARFGEQDVERLLSDAGIVRHRGNAVFPWSVIYDFTGPSAGHASTASVWTSTPLPGLSYATSPASMSAPRRRSSSSATNMAVSALAFN